MVGTLTTKQVDVEKESGKKEKPAIGVRWIFVMITFFAYFVIFFIRNSFPVTMVAMVNSTTDSDDQMNVTKDSCVAVVNSSSSEAENTVGEFSWTASEQGIILGAYFWGFVISRLFLSRVGEKAGQRATAAVGMTSAGILAFLSPLAASISPYALAAARFLTGVSFGPIPATFQSLLSAWAPRNELGKMSTTSLSGATLGGMVGLFSGGWLTNLFGWRIMFWLGGSLILIIVPIWIFVVRNTPFDHPWLSDYERILLDDNKIIRTKKTVPWIEILTSPYVLICVYALFARTWVDTVISTEGPSFFKYKHGMDLNKASYVSGLSYFSSMICILAFGIISDLLINKKYLSTIATRKVFHFIGVGIPSILFILVVLADCNTTLVIILWILIGGIASGTVVSFNVSVIDIAPIYTATVNGMMALGTIGAAVAPTLTSYFIEQGNGWNATFYVAVGLSVISCLLYIPFMTAEPQPWNFYEDEK